MTTVFLRFPDRATFAALLPSGAQTSGETFDKLPGGVSAISVLGTLYTGGTYDAQGNVITAPAPVAGWHVNVLGTVPADWAQYQIGPVTPNRVFG